MGRELRFDVISELKCMWKMPSVPNKMYRHRRIDEAVINEFNRIKQIYKRFQAPFGLNWKMYFQGNLLFSGQNFSAPPVKCLPVRLCLRAQSNLAKCKRIFVPTHNSWRRLKSFSASYVGGLALNLLKFRDTICNAALVYYFWCISSLAFINIVNMWKQPMFNVTTFNHFLLVA